MKENPESESKRRALSTGTLPKYCDYSCPYAAFGDPCVVGACRRDIGVWCTIAGRFHMKHAPCLVRATT